MNSIIATTSIHPTQVCSPIYSYFSLIWGFGVLGLHAMLGESHYSMPCYTAHAMPSYTAHGWCCRWCYCRWLPDSCHALIHAVVVGVVLFHRRPQFRVVGYSDKHIWHTLYTVVCRYSLDKYSVVTNDTKSATIQKRFVHALYSSCVLYTLSRHAMHALAWHVVHAWHVVYAWHVVHACITCLWCAGSMSSS